MMRTLYYIKGTPPVEGTQQENLSAGEIASALENPEGLLWVDLTGRSVEHEPLLDRVFHFHPLAIDDALSETHVPKLDDWGKYLYLVLHAVLLDPNQPGRVETLELDIFLGPNYLVSYHEVPVEAVDSLWSAVQRDPRHLDYGSDHLLYRLADEVVASYMPVVEGLDERIDQAEVQIFDHPTPEILEQIFTLKRAVLYLRRTIGPQREVLNKLARDDYPVIDARARIYFRDVYDHLVRMHEITESVRDLVSGTLDTYLSVINNRMNEIMKTLTLITTLFMPLSFAVGFFGMNFFLPEKPISAWVERPVFVLLMLAMFVMPFGMYRWVRHRGWM
jgi:magnesium transporter